MNVVRIEKRGQALALQIPCAGYIARFHHDERGTISIVSVFTAMLLTMLLGMVFNVGRQVDGKMRMQNAADSAAYSGGLVMARGMNTIAFTNHLLCDVFAMTAFLREARDQNSASYAPQILAAWNKIAPTFSKSSIAKFSQLGNAIQQKTPLEQKMVDSYSSWVQSVSQNVLPLMEEILSDELIPKYQRAVVQSFPDIAQSAARETASRNGEPELKRGVMLGVLWRTDAQPVGGAIEETDERTLPVVDPENDTSAEQSQYQATARAHRQKLAQFYLNQWNSQTLLGFDNYAKMSQFSTLWRSFTCGYLHHLLEVEYPDTNLPMVIRETPQQMTNTNASLERNYIFVAVVYWKKLPNMAAKIFDNPLEADSQAFAEVHMFVPRGRLGWVQPQTSSGPTSLGGVPGQTAEMPGSGSSGSTASSNAQWFVGRVGGPSDWSLLDQNWTCQLAPATQSSLATILQSTPSLPEFSGSDLQMPSLGGLSGQDIQQISPH
jgi:hypothetical protein